MCRDIISGDLQNVPPDGQSTERNPHNGFVILRTLGEILRKHCEWKGVNIVEAECCPDHIHMLLEIPPKMSVSSFIGYLKGKSSLMIYEQFGDLKFKYRNREFWCRGYYVDTVGKNKTKIQEYIRHQIEEDKLGDQLKLPIPGNPFTGRK